MGDNVGVDAYKKPTKASGEVYSNDVIAKLKSEFTHAQNTTYLGYS